MSTSYQKILAVALPATLAVMMGPIASTVDTILIGQREGAWLAPFAASNAIMNSFYHSLNFVLFATSARVAQAYGQNDKQLLHRENVTGLTLALLLGLASVAILVLFEGPFLEGLMGLSGPNLALATEYHNARLLGVPFTLLASAAIGILRGYQNMSWTVVMVVCATVFNSVFTYLCLFVWDLGLWGAGLSTSLSFMVSFGLGFLFIRKRDALLRIWELVPTSKSRELIDWRSFSGDAKYQLIRSFLLNGTLTGMTAICSHASATAVAGSQIIYQIMVMVACLFGGLAAAASSLGGEAIGKGRYRDWWQLCNRSLALTVGLSVIVTAALWLCQDSLLALFTADKDLQVATQPALGLYIAMMPLFGLLYQMEGVLYGAKMFKYVAMSLVIAGALTFAPAFFAAREVGFDTLWAVWFAFGVLNLGRLCVNFYNYWRSSREDFRLVKAFKL